MKFPELWFYNASDDEHERSGIGIDWLLCREGPFITIPKPDKDYYDYIQFIFRFGMRQLRINIFYKKMPYKNKQEYLDFLRASGYYHK